MRPLEKNHKGCFSWNYSIINGRNTRVVKQPVKVVAIRSRRARNVVFSMRRFVIWFLIFLGVSGPVTSFAETIVPEPGASILLYHRFRPTASNFTTVTNESFESQIVWLKENGFTFVRLSTLVDAIREGREPPAKSVAITVDDGHFTQYTNMFPILQKHHVPATLFIYTDGIAENDVPHAMSWNQLKEMQASGLIDIQAHSLTHPNFQEKRNSMSPEAFHQFAMTELIRSKAILEDRLGHKISYFAWPYGAYDRSLAKLAEKAGYEAAFGTDGSQVDLSSHLFALPRFHIKTDTLDGRLAALVMPREKKRTRLVREHKKEMPPRIPVRPALTATEHAADESASHSGTRVVQSDSLVPPADIPSDN